MKRFEQINLSGAGLGFRREMLDEFEVNCPAQVDFMEIAPENWIPLGGKFARQFENITANNKFVAHGLSLSIGGPEPLDIEFVKQIKQFMEQHNIIRYTEHLTYCSGKGHMYDLMPIPFTEEAVKHVVERIKMVQDILEDKIAIENASYYLAPTDEMSEIDFIKEVLEQSDCELLLDVNNIYVNSVNHHYDPIAFMKQLPTERICYGHIAGHFNEAEDLIVDTHGADVIDPVWALLKETYRHHGVFPTLLERDFNIPPTEVLVKEVELISSIQKEVQHYADARGVS